MATGIIMASRMAMRIMITMETGTEMVEPEELLLLLNLTSPTFPTGTFAYSHGLEWAISAGLIRNAEDLETWITDLLVHGSGWNDAVIMTLCSAGNLADMNELALALAPSSERYRESTALGGNFIKAAEAFGLPVLPEAEDIAYPVAIAAAGLSAKLPVEPLVIAYLQNFAATLVSVAVRLVPIGQRAGLQVLARLMPVIAATARRASGSSLDELGSATLGADIASMRHQFQHVRIFRT